MENLNLLGKVDLHLNGFISVRKSKSIAAKHAILLLGNDENLMMLNLFLKMILKKISTIVFSFLKEKNQKVKL